ncbi:MAG TPA: hypothetical protein PLI51_07145 [bacterium]|nr:hypothetical protein [bacterium]HPQ66484.1 hypothetical protein [bacterium]
MKDMKFMKGRRWELPRRSRRGKRGFGVQEGGFYHEGHEVYEGKEMGITTEVTEGEKRGFRRGKHRGKEGSGFGVQEGGRGGKKRVQGSGEGSIEQRA